MGRKEVCCLVWEANLEDCIVGAGRSVDYTVNHQVTVLDNQVSRRHLHTQPRLCCCVGGGCNLMAHCRYPLRGTLWHCCAACHPACHRNCAGCFDWLCGDGHCGERGFTEKLWWTFSPVTMNCYWSSRAVRERRWSNQSHQTLQWHRGQRKPDPKLPSLAVAACGSLKSFRFGLCNAPAIFERLMDKVLPNIVYHDDIMVHATSFQTALKSGWCELGRVARAGLKLHLHKCRLMRQEATFLGHRLGGRAVGTMDNKVQTVKNCAGVEEFSWTFLLL